MDLFSSFIRRRQVLEKECWDEATVLFHIPCFEHSIQKLKAQRASRQILGVLDPEAKVYKYPIWQFQDQKVIEEVGQILALYDQDHPNEDLYGGWDIYTWFIVHHALLEGKAPQEQLAFDPKLVLKIYAQEKHERDTNANW